MAFAPTDSPGKDTFEAIFQALDGASSHLIGSAQPALLVIPIHSAAGAVIGGLWGVTLFRWMHLEMLFVPETMRRQGVGSALVAAAETEARRRDCVGIYTDTLSFQAAPFYKRIGFSAFGVLQHCPPGHQRLFLQKRLVAEYPG